MADEEQAVYEQYPPFKDVRGVRKLYNNILLVCLFLQLLVKTPIEMTEDILDYVAEYVTQNLKMKSVDGAFCKLLRENLDRKFGPAWHVFVGKNFGCYAIHDNNSFTNFKYKGYTYLIYKTTV